jgi:N-acetylglucosamine kinase-like BadF-type ATPase
MAHPDTTFGLGLDAGGTQTRWALAAANARVQAEGVAAGWSALLMSTPEGCERVRTILSDIAQAARRHGRIHAVRAGITGFGGDASLLRPLLAELFDVAPAAVTLCTDIEIAYLSAFQPGQGYLVYAGTGSIGAFIDEQGRFHRAGGRGVVLDDGGGGFWIAREALRHVWRNEDEEPGRWNASILARAVLAHIGSDDWAASREFIYNNERGEVGKLALAVAASAERDPVAADILTRAGQELARLATALVTRHGVRPVVLAGRASTLHPLILQAMRAALPEGVQLTHAPTQAQVGAARQAATSLASTSTSTP